MNQSVFRFLTNIIISFGLTGLKQKLGNCGGGGQCTFCAADFVGDSEGWSPRSDYEDQRLAKTPNARLTCLNNIQGPCTIRL